MNRHVYSAVTMIIADVEPSPPKFATLPVGAKIESCAPTANARSGERYTTPRKSRRMSPAPGPSVANAVRLFVLRRLDE